MATTIRELLDFEPPPADEAYYRALILTLEGLYPDGWKDWVVRNVTQKDLFGETLTPDTEARLRFAVPTIRLARIFRCEKSLSERRYRTLKRKLLEWPIGRALIYQPLSIMIKVHPSGPQNKFDAMLPTLKQYFLPRKEASDILRAEAIEENATSVASSISTPSKRKHTPDPVPKPKRQSNHSSESLSEYMRQQNEILGRLCEITYGLTHQQPPTSRSHVDSEEDSVVNEDSWSPPPLGEEEKPIDPEPDAEEPFLDFAPETKESEAKVSKATDKMVEMGTRCQKLDTDGWQNIRYAEVQKMFQATPVFTALKVNGHLASVTPSWQLVSILEKMDLCLGAVSHGLLQQRTAFEETYANAPPDVKAYLSKHFLTKDKAQFRKVSDSLLQYTCGKRAEILEQRRALYKPQNKTMSELLHAIPPSTTLLFAEPQLSDLIKEQGGVSKVFPGKFKKSNAPTYSKPKGKQGFRSERPTFRKQNQRNPEKRNFNQRPPPKNKKGYEGKKQ